MSKKTNQRLQDEKQAFELYAPAAGKMQLSPDSQGGVSAANDESSLQIGSFISLEKLEAAHLRKIIERAPSLTAAAEILGIDQATLYRKRKRIGLK
jgi:two-component system, NtrC family, response regulator AlgB